MARKDRYSEFLDTLQEALDIDAKGLAKVLGKQWTNVSQYLKGSKKPGEAVVRTGALHLAEWRVAAIYEVSRMPDSLKTVPEKGGIYALYDSAGNVLYHGQATNLRAELNQTLNRKTNFPVRTGPKLSEKAKPKYKALATHLSVYVVESPRLRHNLEALLLRVFPNQSHNNKLGTFK